MENSSSLTVESMKVIFLDVDGVLNSIATFRSFGPDFINDNSISSLAQIVKKTGAKIILASSWRKELKDKKKIEQALKRHDLEIFDCTPIIDNNNRGAEIQSWLNNNKVEKFAILDDDPRAGIEGSFFQTDETIGLTSAIAEQVIAHLL